MITNRDWRRSLASFAISLVTTVGACAAEVLEYHSRVWQLADGLPHVSVQSIAQTADGFLWVGTQKGLARFDGFKFRAFHDSRFPQLSNAAVNALLATDDGTLWIGTARDGLFRLRGTTMEQCVLPPDLQSPPILSLAKDGEGVVWIGLRDGVCRWTTDRQVVERVRDIPSTTIRAIYPTTSGPVWFGTSSGMLEWQETLVSSYTHTNGLRSSLIRAVHVDRDGVLWCGSNTGVARMHHGKITHFTTQNGLRDNTISALYQDRHGTLWVGSYGGLNRWENGKFISEFTSDGLPYDVTFTFFEDAEGNLWIGAKDGLHRLNPKRFKVVTTKHGLSHNNVMSVLEDKAGTLWAGTWGGGLTAMGGDVIKHINSTNGVPLDLVLGLGQAPDGTLWVGTDYNNGLFQIRDDSASRFNAKSSFHNYVLRVVLADRNTNVWVGTGEGLMRLNGRISTRFTTTNGLPGNVIRALLQDYAGRLWVGTDQGLAVQTDKDFEAFPAKEPTTATVMALYEDQDRTLWIGTLGRGLMRWRDGKLTVITVKEGLFSNDVFEVVEDDYGRLWMSCLQGFFHVSKDDIERLSRRELGSLNCVSFGSPDDDTHVQCNGVAKPGAIKRRDGTLAFASTKGLVLIDPGSDLRKNEKAPPVLIERVVAGGEELDRDDRGQRARLEVPPGETVAIHYTALSFRAPDKNRFRYKLENFNDEWIDAGADRIAHYSKLPHGDYIFRVIGSNNDGVWNHEGARVAFTVLPEVWQTLWFKAVLFGSLGALVLLRYRARVARIRQIEGLRLRIAADLHDDVGADLTKLALLVESAMRDTAQHSHARSVLTEAAATSREVIMAMDEIVWTIKPKNDTLENLANYVFRYSQRYCKNTAIRCTLAIPADLPDVKVPTDMRHNLFLAFKEALHNAVKHSSGCEIKVSFAYAERTLTISVSDDGVGFSGEAILAGNGLSNMKSRIEEIGGQFDVTSAPGKGTRIELQVKV